MSDMSKCDGRLLYFCFNDTATTEIYTYLHTLSLHDALPISASRPSPEIASETSRSGAGSDRAPRSGHSTSHRLPSASSRATNSSSPASPLRRPEERRVGKELVRTCRLLRHPIHKKQNINEQ